MPTKTVKSREDQLSERFREIEARYTENGIILLGNATPEELRELGRLKHELTELRAPQPEEATA